MDEILLVLNFLFVYGKKSQYFKIGYFSSKAGIFLG